MTEEELYNTSKYFEKRCKKGTMYALADTTILLTEEADVV